MNNQPFPRFKLSVVIELAQQYGVHVVKRAQNDAGAMGATPGEVFDVVVSLKRTDFYKSMPSDHDHTVWLDVYRPMTKFGKLYVKLTVRERVVILSFKEWGKS